MPIKPARSGWRLRLLLPAMLASSSPALAQQAQGTLMVALALQGGCDLAIREGVPQRPRCAGDARNAWAPTILSDDDPEFSEVVRFEGQSPMAFDHVAPTHTARRYVVDF